jgi:hypothetical protein
MQRDVAETVGAVGHLEQTATQTVDRVTPAVHALLTPVHDTLDFHPVDAVSEILQRVPLDLIDLTRVENLLTSSPGLSALEVGAFSPPASSSPGTPPAKADLRQHTSTRDGLAMRYLAGPGGVEPWLDVRGVAGTPAPGDDPSQVSVDVASHSLGTTGGRPEGLVPLDPNSPTHSLEGPQVAASASGGSSFVPIAALLALLALAAPATLRRLGEVPDCRAPTPFVCALERPG